MFDEPDVVIVGAGAGGLAAAWRLTTQGMRVTVLEAGREYVPSRDYPQTSSDFELRAFPYDPVNDDAGRARYTLLSCSVAGPRRRSRSST